MYTANITYVQRIALICISLIINDVEHFLNILVGHLYVFLREMSIQIICLFFKRFVVVVWFGGGFAIELWTFLFYFGN